MHLGSGWRAAGAICAPCLLLSLSYGALFSVAAWLLTFGLWLIDAEAAIPVLAGGFALLGPLFAAGLYEISRRLERGESVTLRQAFEFGPARYGRLALFGIVLFFAYSIWILLAFTLSMLFLGGSGIPPPSEFMHFLLFSNAGLGLLVCGTLVGAALAALVFSMSTIAAPLLFAKDIDAISAIVTSVRAVSQNPAPMLLWAALIAGFLAQGIVTLFVGLVVAFPLLGHATWHAYRALVDDGQAEPPHEPLILVASSKTP